MTFPDRRRAWPAAVAVSAVLAAIVILEVIFGLWLTANPWERAVALNIVVDRRVIFDATDLYAGGGEVIYTRDRYGLRGNYGDPKNITILTVGGSTTDQRYISDGSTWQDELERQLRAAGRPVRVANAGVDGHSSFGHLASYADWFPLIPGLQPAYTILYLGINDFFLDQAQADFDVDASAMARLASTIKANSAFYRAYSIVRGALLARRLRIFHTAVDWSRITYTATGMLTDSEIAARMHADRFAQRIRRLLGAVRATGSTAVCVTEPTLYYRMEDDDRVVGVDMAIEEPVTPAARINGVDYFRLRRAFDERLAAACASVGALTVDLASARWETADFYDFVHMTPKGATKVGSRIAGAMKRLP